MPQILKTKLNTSEEVCQIEQKHNVDELKKKANLYQNLRSKNLHYKRELKESFNLYQAYRRAKSNMNSELALGELSDSIHNTSNFEQANDSPTVEKSKSIEPSDCDTVSDGCELKNESLQREKELMSSTDLKKNSLFRSRCKTISQVQNDKVDGTSDGLNTSASDGLNTYTSVGLNIYASGGLNSYGSGGLNTSASGGLNTYASGGLNNSASGLNNSGQINSFLIFLHWVMF